MKFKKLIEENKKDFKSTIMFGTSLLDLDADSLRACVCILGKQVERNRKNFQKYKQIIR